MHRRRVRGRHVTRVACSFVLIVLAASGCARHTRTTPLPGEYRQRSVRLDDGHNIVNATAGSPIAATFPSLVRLDQENGFEVEIEGGQVEGKYRLERDSIFLEQDADAGTGLVLAGRVLDDTLDLHMLPANGVNPSGADVLLRFVRSK